MQNARARAARAHACEARAHEGACERAGRSPAPARLPPCACRWYDKAGFAPAFPFGHGLTYGSFSYTNLAISGRVVSFTVALTAGAGCDTPQLYLSAPTAASDPTVPVKVLRHFQKVCEASTDVSFTISDADASVWSVEQASWVLVPGEYGVSIGASSRDIRLTGTVTV